VGNFVTFFGQIYFFPKKASWNPKFFSGKKLDFMGAKVMVRLFCLNYRTLPEGNISLLQVCEVGKQ